MSKNESNWLAGVMGALAAAAVVSEVAGQNNRQLRQENRRLRQNNRRLGRGTAAPSVRVVEVDIARDLRRCTWDSERTRMLENFARYDVELSSDELCDIVNTYTFSSDAMDAVRLLKGFVTDSWRLQIQLEGRTHMFSTDVRRALR